MTSMGSMQPSGPGFGRAPAAVIGIALIVAMAGCGTPVSPSPSQPPNSSSSQPPVTSPSPSTSFGPSPSVGSSAPAVTPGPNPSPPAEGLQAFDEAGITFAYPASWREYHVTSNTSMVSQFAELATGNIPSLCTANTEPSPSGSACPDVEQLPPGSMTVSISNAAELGWAPALNRPPGTTALTVDGLPAYSRTPPSPSADLTLEWAISRPDSLDNYYMIDALLQGPGLDQMRQQLSALVASLRYDPPVILLPTGAGAAVAAEQSALAALLKDSPVWGCFSVTGPHSMVIDSMPDGPTLVRPQLATCTMKIEPTRPQFWRLTLTIRLQKPDRNVGTGEIITQWVSADGSLGLQSIGVTP